MQPCQTNVNTLVDAWESRESPSAFERMAAWNRMIATREMLKIRAATVADVDTISSLNDEVQSRQPPSAFERMAAQNGVA